MLEGERLRRSVAGSRRGSQRQLETVADEQQGGAYSDRSGTDDAAATGWAPTVDLRVECRVQHVAGEGAYYRVGADQAASPRSTAGLALNDSGELPAEPTSGARVSRSPTGQPLRSAVKSPPEAGTSRRTPSSAVSDRRTKSWTSLVRPRVSRIAVTSRATSSGWIER